MADRFLQEFDQRRWASDIESYERLKAIKLKMVNPSEQISEHINKRLSDIEARYPQYLGPRAHGGVNG